MTVNERLAAGRPELRRYGVLDVMSDQREQPPLPFDPALQLRPQPPAEPQELSLETFAARLFEEVARRSAAIAEREQRRSA